ELIIVTGYFTIFRDFIVLIAAGAEAPGTNTVEFEAPFKQYSYPKGFFIQHHIKLFRLFLLAVLQNVIISK
ncbi:MAG: hypothetical protein QOA17_10015, partial [Nitrososphaeraceae archaeon]|nr:hypothetical protein [Nitrososphaeraceae archaeon]